MKFWGFLIFLSNFLTAQQMDVNHLRQNYKSATENKAVCNELLRKLDSQSNSGINLAYYGALQSVWAKHVNNPIEKLRTFRKGKKNIEMAIKQKPDNLEIRFLRYSVQKGSPGFLGYKSNMDDDRNFLQKNLHTIDNLALKQMIQQVLKAES